MSINLSVPFANSTSELRPRISVIGVGGAGGNAVNNMIRASLEGVEFIKSQPERAYNLIGTVKDFNIPSDLAKTMLGGVKLADYADNRSFMGAAGSNADYNNILGMAQDMYREARIIKHTFNPEESLDRRYVEKLADSFSMASSEAPIEYKEPAKGATPIATQHRCRFEGLLHRKVLVPATVRRGSEQVVQGQTGIVERPGQRSAVEREDERLDGDQMRGQSDQSATLVERLPDKPDPELLEIAQAAVDQP